MDVSEFFRNSYPALTGHPDSFPWQEELFLRFCKPDVPIEIVLPTGCGKTSVIAVWMLALAWQAREGPDSISLPRRLAWVVNRRVVVDQATDEAGKLRNRLNDSSLHALDSLRQALRKLSSGSELLGISTLRGQFADNAEWRDEPARPAIIVGTVDMIGSRLLFSGYGTGFKSRPLHAGFLGQDVLLVHDEAHLEPAFQHLLEAIRKEQEKRREFRSFRSTALTATARGGTVDPFRLTDADRRPGTEIQKRIGAPKGIRFHAIDSEKKLADKILECALEFRTSGSAILIFLREVKQVQNVAAKLCKEVGEHNVTELTGTIRGYERDLMSKDDRVFARFAPDSTASRQEGTVYLVCTSAGEVGVNMSADHLVCDLAPLDSMIQRFGRVNRFGTGSARIEIVHADMGVAESDFDVRRARTLALLQKLSRRSDGRNEASPASLERLRAEERDAAFTPEPTILPTSEILFDVWALTSVRDKMPGRPSVGDWLHGIAEWEPAQTFVGWREEVQVITEDLEAKYSPEDLLEDYPPKPQELLRDNSKRVKEQLQEIARRKPDIRAWLVDAEDNVRTGSLGKLLPDDSDELRDCTLLLPPEAGGLTKSGMLAGSAEPDELRKYDVADEWHGGERRRRLWNQELVPDGMRQTRAIEIANEEEDSERRRWVWYVREAGSRNARQELDWDDHTKEAGRIAGELVVRLGLLEPERSAVIYAAKWHDMGKRRDLWQKSIGNREYPDRVLAKSGPTARGFYCRYRHELGSLVDASSLPEFATLAPEVQDLVLHLIAAHHGRAAAFSRRRDLRSRVSAESHTTGAGGPAALCAPPKEVWAVGTGVFGVARARG
jgi:CRISPR-associated endonuclease/helicase Cas3